MNRIVKANKLKDYQLILLYIIAFVFIYTILYNIGIIGKIPVGKDLINWDTIWYDKIMREGYSYYPDRQCSVAFFPLMPYLWRFLGGNIYLMMGVNILLYFSSALFFFKMYELKVEEKLFLLSMPPLMFNYLAYSESLFFFFGMLIIYGLRQKQLKWILLGVLGAGFSRSAIIIFLPSFLFLWIMTWDGFSSKKLQHIGLVLFVSLLTIAVTNYIQWYQTEEWFAFSKVQIHWDHKLQFPNYPLKSWSSHAMDTDLPALIIGVFCGFEVLVLFLNKIKVLKNRELSKIASEELFSLGYCFAIAMFVFLSQGGDTHSLNRYIFATVYFWLFFTYFKRYRFRYHWIILGLSVFFCIYAGALEGTGELTGPDRYLKIFGFTVVILLGLFLMGNEKKQLKWLSWIGIGLLFFLQIHYLHLFLVNKWIG